MKVCIKCLVNKDATDFYRRKITKDGLYATCKSCMKADASTRYRSKKEYVLETSKNRYWSNREKYTQKMSAWFQLNKIKLRPLRRGYSAYRRASKLQATPGWLSLADRLEMKKIYENCPDGYHVDHIIPLQGEIVCGLHVPWNLQYLPASENIRKSNKLLA